MSNFHYSSNNILSVKSGKTVFPYLIPTAVILLILSFLLKTVGQAFLIGSAVLFIIAGAVLFAYVKNKGCFIMCLILSLFCLRGISTITGDVAKAKLIDGKEDYITATVITAPQSTGDTAYGYCTVRVDSSNCRYLSQGEKVNLFADGIINFEIGDILKSSVKYSAFDKEREVAFYSEGVFINAACTSSVMPIARSNGVYGVAGSIRKYIKTKVMSGSDNYHILLAMIMGERSYVSDSLYNRVIDAGVSHILVVSGMHLVLICGGLERILNAFVKKKLITDLFVLSFVFMMSVICGFGMSIMRAAIVYVIRVIYRQTGRRNSGIHSLCLAAVIVLLINPFAFWSVSFQLSYSATLGIMVLPKVFNKRFIKYTRDNFILKEMADIISISLSAFIATLPVCVAAFGTFSVVAVPANILLDIPCNFMLIFSLLSFVVFPFLGDMLLNLSDMLADYFLKIVDFAGNLPFAKIPLRNARLLTVVILLIYFLIYVIKTKAHRILIKR